MAVSRAAIESAGLLDETAVRLRRGRGLVACGSVRPASRSSSFRRRGCVTTAAASTGGLVSPSALYYNARNTLAVCERHRPLPPGAASAAARRRRGDAPRCRLAADRRRGRAVIEGWRDYRAGRMGAEAVNPSAAASTLRTLGGLLERGVLDTAMRVLVAAGGAADRDVFLRLGFRDVTITNVDEPAAGEYAPYRWEQPDAEALTYPTRRFDWTVVSAGLHHCRSPHRALLELYRVARRGVLALEARDSALMRAAIRARRNRRVRAHGGRRERFRAGGVRNTAVPNYVYRWTEREVRKTIASARTARAPRVPLVPRARAARCRSSRSARRSRRATRPDAPRAPAGRTRGRAGAAGPGEPVRIRDAEAGAARDLQPWLRATADGPAPDEAWIRRHLGSEARAPAAARRPAARRPARRRARPLLRLRRGHPLRAQLVGASAEAPRTSGGRLGGGVRTPRDAALRALLLEPARAAARRRAARALREKRRRPSPSSCGSPASARSTIAEINAVGEMHRVSRAQPRLRHSEYGEGGEDIQALSYADESFDLVLTSETLEHVPRLAARRSPRPGGCCGRGGRHVFTVPLVPGRERTEDVSARGWHHGRGSGSSGSSARAATCSCTRSSAGTCSTSCAGPDSSPSCTSATRLPWSAPRGLSDAARGRSATRRAVRVDVAPPAPARRSRVLRSPLQLHSGRGRRRRTTRKSASRSPRPFGTGRRRRVRACIDTAAIRATFTRNVAIASASTRPRSSSRERMPSDSGMSTARMSTARGTSTRGFSARRAAGRSPRTQPPRRSMARGRRPGDQGRFRRALNTRPRTKDTRVPPTSAKTPAAAPISVRLSQDASITWFEAPGASRPRRVSGADEMRESDDAVAATSVAPNRYAYVRLVWFPSPSPDAPRNAIG